MKVFHWLSTFCLPYNCILCQEKTYRQLDLCQNCENELPWLASSRHCRQCANLLMFDNSQNNICGECLQKKPPFDRVYALFRYQAPINNLIGSLKFQHKLIYAKILGTLLGEKIKSYLHDRAELSVPEVIIPVSLHHHRLRKRGFNQALELARPVSKILQIPICPDACQRIRHTEAQSSISAKLRQENIKNAFAVNKHFFARHIAIVDDVITTGNTMTEISQVFRKHGVEEIEIWSVARTF